MGEALLNLPQTQSANAEGCAHSADMLSERPSEVEDVESGLVLGFSVQDREMSMGDFPTLLIDTTSLPRLCEKHVIDESSGKGVEKGLDKCNKRGNLLTAPKHIPPLPPVTQAQRKTLVPKDLTFHPSMTRAQQTISIGLLVAAVRNHPHHPSTSIFTLSPLPLPYKN